jgi:hypothetical protein
MLSAPVDPPSHRPPPPSRLTAGLVALAVAGMALPYFVSGCSHDWVVIGGLCVNTLGAFILVVPDVPALADRLYVNDLRDVLDDLSTETPPPITQGSRLENVLYSSISEYRTLSSTASFSFDAAENIIEVDDNGDTEEISLTIVQHRLMRQVRRESGRIRRVGLYLLAFGFLLQVSGLLVGSTILLDLPLELVAGGGDSVC